MTKYPKNEHNTYINVSKNTLLIFLVNLQQFNDLVPLVFIPSGHGVQASAPIVGLKKSEAHSLHSVPLSLYVPAGHSDENGLKVELFALPPAHLKISTRGDEKVDFTNDNSSSVKVQR